MNYLYEFLVVFFAVLAAHYAHGFIFTTFKANQYEDLLAQKIAKEVKEHIDKKSNQGSKD